MAATLTVVGYDGGEFLSTYDNTNGTDVINGTTGIIVVGIGLPVVVAGKTSYKRAASGTMYEVAAGATQNFAAGLSSNAVIMRVYPLDTTVATVVGTLVAHS